MTLSLGTPARSLLAGLLVGALALPAAPLLAGAAGAAPAGATLVTRTPAAAGSASAFLFYVLPTRQPMPCSGFAQNFSTDPFIDRGSCAFTSFTVTGASGTLSGALYAAGASDPFATTTVSAPTAGGTTGYQVSLRPDATWAAAAGPVRLVILDGTTPIGETSFFFNTLVADLDAGAPTAPGEPFTVTGTISEHVVGATASDKAVPATFTLEVTEPGNDTPIHTAPVTAESDGAFSVTVPGAATAGLTGEGTSTLAVSAVDASYTDTAEVPPPATGLWKAPTAGVTPHAVNVPSTTLDVVNRFVSSVGWVKPGDTYPSTITVSNNTTAPATPSVALTAPVGTTFQTATGPGTHVVAPSAFTWVPGTIAPGDRATLVLTSKARTTTQLPTIVWRDLSSTAVLSASGQADETSVSHGPKVIPGNDVYDTARYGDRPFPIIPVQYTDRTYVGGHSGESLAQKINDPGVAGSTFNLYQEMSLGQLFPNGTVPSAGIATADFEYGPGFEFQQTVPGQTCTGTTYGDLPADVSDTPLYPERISNGVYNLPGQTQFYGADSNGSAIVGSAAGVGALQNIDSGCGPTGKLVRDAAALADPELDYSDYDTDKDGVVDFFMVVFAGCGGNGGSQLGACTDAQSDTAPYDNIWPHSSSLEGAYSDAATGLPGYTTDDQLKDLQDRPLWYTDDSYSSMTTTDMGDALKVFVRVGPYNVNPETAIDKASVISHEYGHSLGLPDFYSTGSRSTYGDWNLMATDKSHHIDAFGRQELGWVVPRVLTPGQTTSVTGWKNSKFDTGTIAWQTPDGTPYTLSSGADGIVHNSEMYVAKLPGRQLLDPASFDTGDKASLSHLWWSGSGNDFGCAPTGGHNFDLSIPGLATLPDNTPVELRFKSRWDIEWDFDYAFVLTTTDGGATYASHASNEGYTTSKAGVPGNPNMSGCLDTYDNGITGTSGSYAAGTEAVDRLAGNVPDSVFLSDSYDITDLAGQSNGALRFSYSTDPGLARPGWFIDDVEVVATVDGTERTIYSTDFESSGGPNDDSVFNGGCRSDLTVASGCTRGFTYLTAGTSSLQDHAYYLEMRDRSGFDLDGNGEIDRDPIGFEAGLYLSYTDEAHGYGNVGVDDPPAQSPLDSVPTPGSAAPNLNDASFQVADARSTFTDAPATPHVDNYSDPRTTSGDWEFAFDCLSFKVTSMSGTDAAPVGNLTGDVDFDLGDGCGAFNYGHTPDPVVPNTAPSAAAAATPTAATTGQLVSFSAAGSTDAEDPSGLDYSWDFGDGGSDKDATGTNPQFAYTTAGTYTVTLTVTDPQGLTDTAAVTVVVTGPTTANTAPTADAAANPTAVVVGQTVNLSGAGSTDAETPNGLSYSWDFDNGGTTTDATTKTTTVSYGAAGTYDVVLTVTDPQGLSDTDTVTITVTVLPPVNTAPTADATATPSSVESGEQVALSGNASTDAETPGDLTYAWDFDNGGTTSDATGKNVTTSYPAPGTYTVTLTVTDPGGLSDTDTATVTVSATASDTTKPTIVTTVTPQPVFIRKPFTISAAGTFDDTSDSDDLTYTWDKRDGGTKVDVTGPSLTATFNSPGLHSYRLSVTDEAGNRASKLVRVQVFRYVPCNATSVDWTDDFTILKSKKALKGLYCGMPKVTRGPDVVRTVFKGPKVVLLRGLARNGGSAEVFVDGVKKATVTFHTKKAGLSFRHRTVIDGLGKGSHRIVVRMTRGKGYVEGFLRYH